ncbi:MAG: Trigger factor [Candidatus Moranbacteria bacterium GW2011_GWA2_39_41]|nr:MAG: Trigger factor [Candidatus Moranbacteria bacterium GW2011_GWA2_39_41]
MIKKLPKSQIEFEVTVPWSQWEKYLDKAAAEVSEEIKIAGFRPGKAPRKMVEQKVGAGVILNNAVEKAVQKSYVDFIVKEKIDVIGNPAVEIEEIAEGKDLVYTVKVAVVPTAELKEDYKKEIKKINAEFAEKKTEASEEEIAKELEHIANSRVKLVTVAREIAKDDSAEIDFTVLVDGVPIEGGTSKKHPLVIGKGVFIPGFEENLIGMKEGEEKEFELKFPAEYHKKDLAGRMATFKVKIGIVQERQTPQIDDEFAKSLGEFENLAALKKNLKEGIEEENSHKLSEEKRTKFLEKIVDSLKVELPEIMIREEVQKMMLEFDQQTQSMGMNIDQYLAHLKKEKKDLEKDWEPQAEKRVKSALALREIVKQEEIKVEASEIELEMNKTVQYYKNVKDFDKNIDMERLYSYTKGILENEEVFKMLDKI